MNLGKWITALGVLAVFTALAGAQVIQPVAINCTVTAATTPAIRSEGQTELVGDILITCTGGPAPIVIGNPTDRATVTVNFGVPVTSNLDSGSGIAGASEALLSVDEPNTVTTNPLAPGYGQSAPVSLCTAAQSDVTISAGFACPAYQELSSNGTSGFYVMASTSTPANAQPGANAANVYQGVVGTGTGSGKNGLSVNTVTFYNVPVFAPVQAGVTRVYRVMNVRVDPGSASSVTATVAAASANTVSSTGTVIGSATALSLTNSTAVVATSAASLATAVAPLAGLSLCEPTVLYATNGSGDFPANASLLNFTENTASAFKTRILPLAGGSEDAIGLTGDLLQGSSVGAITGSFTVSNVSYSAQNSESGFLLPIDGNLTAGLANNGTRLKAVFTNLPANASYYVSVFNVTNYSNVATLPTNGPGDSTATPFAVLQYDGTQASGVVASETAPYSAAPFFTTFANGPGQPLTQQARDNARLGEIFLANEGVPVAQLFVKNNAAEAVWEITNNNYAAAQTFQFAVYVVYNTITPPATGATGAVQLGYAATASTVSGNPATTIIPRFSAPSAAPATFLTIVPCQTSLLFPFVSTAKVTPTQHWETGIAISNTGDDPWGSVPVPTAPNANSTCTLYYFGAGATTGSAQFAPPNPTGPGPVIGPGQSWTFVASDPLATGIAPNVGFSGYIFAVCNFQFAHGFAFVEDNSTAGNAMGYLALVVDNRSAVQRAATLTGEDLSQ